jgi:hypothetical protein
MLRFWCFSLGRASSAHGKVGAGWVCAFCVEVHKSGFALFTHSMQQDTAQDSSPRDNFCLSASRRRMPNLAALCAARPSYRPVAEVARENSACPTKHPDTLMLRQSLLSTFFTLLLQTKPSIICGFSELVPAE